MSIFELAIFLVDTLLDRQRGNTFAIIGLKGAKKQIQKLENKGS